MLSLPVRNRGRDYSPELRNRWNIYKGVSKLNLTPWFMEPGGSMPYSQGPSNNPYP